MRFFFRRNETVELKYIYIYKPVSIASESRLAFPESALWLSVVMRVGSRSILTKRSSVHARSRENVWVNTSNTVEGQHKSVVRPQRVYIRLIQIPGLVYTMHTRTT